MKKRLVSFEPGDGSFTVAWEVQPGTYKCVTGGPEVLDLEEPPEEDRNT